MGEFREIGINEFPINPFELKNKWMLISAAKEDGTVNTMTASWGGFGILWNKNIAFVVIRPQRYTKEFVDSTTSFSLTFFDKKYLKTLGYLGKVSGRDEDKIAASGLSIMKDNEVPFFEEAECAVIVKKLYSQPMGEEFFADKTLIESWYPQKDLHVIYFAEISKILVKTPN